MDNKINNNNNNFFENKLIKNKDSVFNNIFINDETTIQKKILIYKIIATLTAIINLFFSEYIKFLLLVEIILIIYLIFNFLLNLRKTDICIRYGGDEFLILLNKISIKNSIKLTERIINIINNTIIIFDNKKLNFTISCGISEIPLNYTYKEAIKFVDEKLYKAKKEGKNKIIY